MDGYKVPARMERRRISTWCTVYHSKIEDFKPQFTRELDSAARFQSGQNMFSSAIVDEVGHIAEPSQPGLLADMCSKTRLTKELYMSKLGHSKIATRKAQNSNKCQASTECSLHYESLTQPHIRSATSNDSQEWMRRVALLYINLPWHLKKKTYRKLLRSHSQ